MQVVLFYGFLARAHPIPRIIVLPYRCIASRSLVDTLVRKGKGHGIVTQFRIDGSPCDKILHILARYRTTDQAMGEYGCRKVLCGVRIHIAHPKLQSSSSCNTNSKCLYIHCLTHLCADKNKGERVEKVIILALRKLLPIAYRGCLGCRWHIAPLVRDQPSPKLLSIYHPPR